MSILQNLRSRPEPQTSNLEGAPGLSIHDSPLITKPLIKNIRAGHAAFGSLANLGFSTMPGRFAAAHKIVLALLLPLLAPRLQAQTGFCPPNLDLSTGTFQNWQCYTGKADNLGIISYDPSPPIDNRHNIIDPSIQPVDHFGQYPVPYPGCTYALRLGNLDLNDEIDKVSYRFTIPANVNDFSLVYYYALTYYTDGCGQPVTARFLAEAFDETTDSYTDCRLSVSGGDYPDVKITRFPGRPVRDPGFAKPWAAAIMNFKNRAGHTIRLEFSATHCNAGRHFMIAYLSIRPGCQSAIDGASLCNGKTAIMLKAPVGFENYQWYSPGFSQVLGTGNTLTLNPAPPPGVKIPLVLSPYLGLGCGDTVYATVRRVGQPAELLVHDPVLGCELMGVNLTLPAVTQGSSPGLTFTYHTDSLGNGFIFRPTRVRETGTYYIAAKNDSGCYEVKPVRVKIYPKPNLVVPDTLFGCYPHSLSLTNPAITSGSDTGLHYEYLTSMLANTKIPDPDSVTESGLYFIRGINSAGCETTKPVTVAMARLQVDKLWVCDSGSLRTPQVTQGSTPGFSLSYWLDAAATIPLTNPDSIKTSGTYFIRALHNSGCSIVKPVPVTVFPSPVFSTANPPAVTYPSSINLYNTVQATAPLRYSFWTDTALTDAVKYPQTVVRSGAYFIRGTAANGCASVQSVQVTVLPPPPFTVKAPNAFSPNGDGVNDEFVVEAKPADKIEGLRVFDRWGQEVFAGKTGLLRWDGRWNGQPAPVGVYYWVVEGWDGYHNQKLSRTGSVTLVR